jgi:hypothetical protein
MKDNLYYLRERKEKSRFRYGPAAGKDNMQGFKCGHCHAFVATEPGLSGVQNRNHCPYCLWSRHLDLYEAGDRLSACKVLMQPIALTMKHISKKYGPGCGELMLVHACMECEALSINRIAADDDPQRLVAVFEDSFHLGILQRTKLDDEDIHILDAAERRMVHMQLFGHEIERTEMFFQSRMMETI